MSRHLFSMPVECANCGTVVDDSRVDHCPQCGEILRERRTPSRLAGVERRYGHLRILSAILRFIGVAVAVVGTLLFVFGVGEGDVPWTTYLMVMLGALLGAAAAFAVAAFFEVAMDIEENSRSSFRLQNLILEQLEEPGRAGREGGEGSAPSSRPAR